MGHAIEDLNERIKTSAKRFFDARTLDKDGKPRRVIDLHQRNPLFYKKGETAYEGGFASPGMGKVYKDGSTELVAEGLRLLATNPKALYDVDPEHVFWLLGLLGGTR